jgi:hypothetical protein
MNQRWDLLVKNRDGDPILIIEVKRQVNVSQEWVMQLHRNLFSAAIFPKSSYFLIAFPDKFYLWVNTSKNKDEPDYTIDAKPLIQKYFEKTDTQPNQISGISFEIIIASWLQEMIFSEELPEHIDREKSWLVESGLYQALRGSNIEYEAVA